MSYRLSLIMGLLVSLPNAALPAARGADGSAQAAASATSGATTITDLSSWKRSDRAASADIRFKKPDGIVFTDQAEEPKQNAATISSNSKPAAAPIATDAPIAAAAAAPVQAPVANQAQTPITIVPATIAAPAATIPATAAPAAPATATAAPIAVAPTATIPAIQPTIQPAGAAALPAGTSSLHTDDQIQLVARLLMDQGVIRAADEEPLPASPNSASANGQANQARQGNGNDLAASGECYDNCECCPPPPCLFWVGGVEATFLSPDFNRDGVTFQTERIDDDGTETFLAESSDTDSLYISPRIWLGVQGCCWGANLRYWHLQAEEGEYDPSIGGLGTWDDYDCGRPDVGFFTCSSLEAYTIDLEVTRRFCLHDCWMQASMGVRHAELWADDGITGLALTEEGLLNGFGRANRNSRGTGILLGLYGRKPIFPCSCVNWFYNARWSALWGSTQTSAETFAAVQSSDPDFVASAASVNGAYTTIDDTMYIGEIQLGLEWDYCLCCLPANAFFRVAIEYQRWDGGQGYSAADSFAGITIVNEVDPTSVVSTTAAADEPQLDLFGFSIGTGLTW